MSFDDDFHLWIGAEELRRLREGIAGVGSYIRLVVIEIGVFHAPVEELLLTVRERQGRAGRSTHGDMRHWRPPILLARWL